MGENGFSWEEVRHAEGDGAKAANLVFGRNRAFMPWVDFALAIIINEAQALAFEILEIKRQAAMFFCSFLKCDAALIERSDHQLKAASPLMRRPVRQME